MCPSQSALLRLVEKLGRETDEYDETFTVRLLVFKSQVGGVIGKGGSVITALRETTGAKIRLMPKMELPNIASADDELLQVRRMQPTASRL